jgi:NitT/TauT family transport system ATP-binding protein
LPSWIYTLSRRRQRLPRTTADRDHLLDRETRTIRDVGRDTMEFDRVIEELEQGFSSEEARRQLETPIDWGRFAELFTYDQVAGEFRLDEEHRARDVPQANNTPELHLHHSRRDR